MLKHLTLRAHSSHWVAMPRIQDHLSKLSWVAADRLLFVLYGFVALLQIRALPPSDYGLYALLVSIQTWMFVLADGLVLQGVVQFGADRQHRASLDGTAAMLYTAIIALLIGAILLGEPMASRIFGEPRFQEVVRWEVLFCLVTIPRAFSLRLLQRDIQPRQVFWIDAAWLGSMSIATLHGIVGGWLRSFETLAVVAVGGMAISSAMALWVCRGLWRWTVPRWEIATRLLRFGLGQMSTSAIHTSVRQLDVALAQVFFGTAAVGTYQAAKTIFRLFEVGVDAAASVVYPAAVRYFALGDRVALHAITTKSLSVTFVVYGVLCAIVWIGSDVLGVVLGQRYQETAALLRMMSLAALVMPLMLSGVVLVAAGRVGTHAAIAMAAAVTAAALFIASGIAGMLVTFPLGIVCYYAVLGIGNWWMLRQRGILPMHLADLWRSIPDAVMFVRARMK